MNLSKTQERIVNDIETGAGRSQWRNWTWQMRHCVRDLDTFEQLLCTRLSKDARRAFETTIDKFPMSITPYYLSLINTDDLENDPIFKQSFPSPLELSIHKGDMADPLHEDKDSPVEGLTHRYPDRALLLVSNRCSMYCRHCTRKRRVGDVDSIPDRKTIKNAIDYIRQTPRIRDVLLSGGDPFLLSDSYLDWILTELQSIDHVEVVRIGTRTPVVMPYRITESLVAMLKTHQPL